MIKFFHAGGFSMWVVLLFSLIVLVAAVRFALRADLRKLSIVRAMTWALVFAALSGVVTNFMAVMWNIPKNDEWARSPDLPLIVMQGLGEAVTPAVLAFTVLALVWLLVAVGTRRLQDQA
jgi:hypothetical protein